MIKCTKEQLIFMIERTERELEEIDDPEVYEFYIQYLFNRKKELDSLNP